MILINLKTLLPIGRNKNDELYAILPEKPLSPSDACLIDVRNKN